MDEHDELDPRIKDTRGYKIAAGKGVMNLPNKLTISRMVMIPVFIVLFCVDFTAHYFVALAVFAIASLTDLFDGKIARKYHLVTNLGKFLDPIADKVLVLSALCLLLARPEILSYGGSWVNIVAGVGVAVILAREIIISGFRMVAASGGMVIAADMIGKYKTVFQMFAVIILIAFAGLAELIYDNIATKIFYYTGLAMFGIAVVLTIISGVFYLVKNREVLKK